MNVVDKEIIKITIGIAVVSIVMTIATVMSGFPLIAVGMP